MLTRLPLLFVLLVALIAPTTSVADDASLKQAGTSRDATFKTLGKQAVRAARSWARSPRSATRARRLVRVLRRTRKEIKTVSAEIKREQPSSDAGVQYKRYGLASLRDFSASLRLQERSVAATIRGKPRLGRRYVARADRLLERAERYERKAKKALP